MRCSQSRRVRRQASQTRYPTCSERGGEAAGAKIASKSLGGHWPHRAEILDKMGLRAQRRATMSVSNALTALTKGKQSHEKNASMLPRGRKRGTGFRLIGHPSGPSRWLSHLRRCSDWRGLIPSKRCCKLRHVAREDAPAWGTRWLVAEADSLFAVYARGSGVI